MVDSAGRLVELVTVGPWPPVLLEVVCLPAKVGSQKTRQWLTKKQLEGLLQLLGPVLEEVAEGGTLKQASVVEGGGLRAAVVTRQSGGAFCSPRVAVSRVVVRVGLTGQSGGLTDLYNTQYF